MHQTKKGKQYYFDMKFQVGVGDESGLVHSVVGTASNVADVTQVDKLLHGAENVVCADAGYTGVEKRTEHGGREVVNCKKSCYKVTICMTGHTISCRIVSPYLRATCVKFV
ncbi:Transposase [Pseudomonas syringae pv. philadelphi]|nr:Transposase [Pseudomonas syringae pv. berberidis]KPY27067.1 Transposase [Pseudomonas syringae pv. philadelphi]RMM26971.1 Transposase [Pseudomonas syringae pv. berberidis]RMQ29549.1 Transposase [Pseudomonas syringae pv. berberidis]